MQDKSSQLLIDPHLQSSASPLNLESKRGGSKDFYTRRLNVLSKSVTRATDFAAASAVLLDSDPHFPRAIRQQAPDLDLYIFVIDR